MMSAPRLEIDLDKIRHNTRALVKRLAGRGIALTGVTKAFLGCPKIARTMLGSGVAGLGDSRIENLQRMRWSGIDAPMTLIRSPMMSQVDEVVATADVSLNTESTVIKALSAAAVNADCSHGVVLMVELGDLREGIMPEDMVAAVRETLGCANIRLAGIGTNLACQNGVVPDATKMGELSALAAALENKFGIRLKTVSGGNSGNLPWAFGESPIGRINDLRLGESILLGREPLHRQPIAGLYTDAIQLVGEVIEIKTKPIQPWGEFAETAFGDRAFAEGRGHLSQGIVALGHQDVDPSGLGFPEGLTLRGASSDHLVVSAVGNRLAVGDEIGFTLNYSALLRAMTSPFVTTVARNSKPSAPRELVPA